MTRATSGGFSSGSYDGAPYILMNYNNTVDNLFTLAHELAQLLRIGHLNHMAAMRHLMAWRIGIAIDRDHLHPEPLQCDDDLFAEFPAAEQHDAGGGG